MSDIFQGVFLPILTTSVRTKKSLTDSLKILRMLFINMMIVLHMCKLKNNNQFSD